MKTLIEYAKDRHSQNGEDGILAEIFKRLSIKTGWFVEFGASDGIRLSNTFALLEDGWNGVDLEGDDSAFKELEQTAKKFPKKLYPLQAFVAPEGDNSLDVLLKTTPIPKDFELLSVDIDSYDYWIWKSLTNYSPKVVVIEINSSIAPGKRHVQAMDEGEFGERGTGSSFTSMLELGQEKGYTLVAHTGNMIFVHNDLVDKLGLSSNEISNPDALFRRELLPPDNSFTGKIKRKLNLGS